jgi:hypothetical protein
MKPKSPIDHINPNPDIDPAVEEMLHSLFDGRAKHRVNPASVAPLGRGERRKVKVTLATRVEFLNT